MGDSTGDRPRQDYEDWTRNEFRERFPSSSNGSALTSKSLTDLPEKNDPYWPTRHPSYNKPLPPRSSGDGYTGITPPPSTGIQETDNTDPRRSLSNILTRFADRTSCVGPPYISSSNHFYSKFFWSVVFVGMIVATVVNVYNNFDTYYSRPIKTTVAIGYSPLTFPTVTVCNTNAVRKTALALGSQELQDFISIQDPDGFQYQPPPGPGFGTPGAQGQSTPGGQGQNTPGGQGQNTPGSQGQSTPGGQGQSTPGDQNQNQGQIRGPRGRNKRFVDRNQRQRAGDRVFGPPRPDVRPDNDGDSLDPRFEAGEDFSYLLGLENTTTRYEMGHHLETMLLSCSFEGRSCEAGNFSTFLTDDFGLCYSFNQFKLTNKNAPKFRRSFRHGNVYGFQLMLFLDVDEYIPGVTLGYGARLSISYPTTMAFPSTDGLFISSGVETDVGVKMVNISRLPDPYPSKCTDDPRFTRDFGYAYTRGACQATCPHRHILETCNCYESSKLRLYPKGTDAIFSFCNSTADFECIANVKQGVLVDGTLSCNCPNPCNETTYDLLISSREWPEQNYLKALVDSVCRKEGQDVNCNKLRISTLSEQKRNFLKLNVFYRDLNYETLTQEPDYPDSQFLSDLGGSVGLWIGLSVMSLVEVVELVGEIFVWLCRKCRRACGDNNGKKARSGNGGNSVPQSSQGSTGRCLHPSRNKMQYRPAADR